MESAGENFANKVERAKDNLDHARRQGHPLQVALAEAALNDLLDYPPVTVVTGNNRKGER